MNGHGLFKQELYIMMKPKSTRPDLVLIMAKQTFSLKLYCLQRQCAYQLHKQCMNAVENYAALSFCTSVRSVYDLTQKCKGHHSH